MASGSGMTLDGLSTLFAQLDSLGEKGDKAQDKALKAGGTVFLKLMQGKVSTSTNHKTSHLKQAMKVSAVKRADDGEKYVTVGTYLGRGRYRNNVYWGHIVEGGHVLKSRTGNVIGYVSAKPFMQSSFEQGQDAAAQAIGDIVFQGMGL